MNAVIQQQATSSETLADLRRIAGKTTRETGAALGLTQPRITQIEQEGTKDVEQIAALSAFYGIDFQRVLEASARTRQTAKQR